ncbi:MAG: magnesium/cobalt transporter CorA [Ignavibacteria bacterium]|nr:magnesium/cobalt transporter CorA [Ignavibacteria bacterium]MBK7185274.1 magnesium/cobalt transporter CorA [Ignavibacteria bacterium]MBK9182483.1 magnesium/cobalt transporter CorA [Ignavibacteria bacterium]MBL0322909.1 magnesium/cobalt transporter CorA [Ignavibacteria bacterium]
MIDIHLYRNDATTVISPDQLLAHSESLLQEDEMIWVDLSNPTPEEEQLVLQSWFPVHELVISDIRHALSSEDDQDFHHPKVDDLGTYLYVIMHALIAPDINTTDAANYLRLTTEAQLNIIISERVLITHHAGKIDGIKELQSSCGRNTHIMKRGPDYLLHLLLDDLVDDYMPLVSVFEDRVQELEHLVFKSPGNLTLMRILETKRLLQKVRRDVVYQREIVNRLARGEFALISPAESVYYRNVYDHLVRIADQVDTSRELAMSIMEAYFSVSSARLNQVMKVLTVISTIFLPITFITSLYGMNFEFMPELHTAWGYPAVIALIITIATTMYVIFRKRGWID